MAWRVAGAPARKKQGGGFLNLGIGNLVEELSSIPGGLVRLGASLAPGGEPAGRVASAFGKGALSSFGGTLGAIPDALQVPWLGNQIRSDVAGLLGEEYRPQSLTEAYRSRGLLAPLVEHVGNIALGAGAAGKLATLGNVGRAGAAEAAGSRALAAGYTAEDIGRATTAAEAGRAGFREAGVSAPKLREAGRAAVRAGDAIVDEVAVANRARTINRLYSTAHPYHSMFEQAIQPLGHAATARSITAATAPSPLTDLMPDRAAAVAAGLGAEVDLLDEVPSSPTRGPVEETVRRQAHLPTPEWADSVVAKLPDQAVRALHATDRFVDARQASKVLKERIRMQDIDRRSVLRSGPVKEAVDVAGQHIVGRTLPDGTRVTPALADELLGDEIIARLDLTEVLESNLIADAPPEAAAVVRQAFEAAGARSENRLPPSWLVDTDGTPSELSTVIDDLTASMRGMAAQRLETLRSNSRMGDRGLESVDSSIPALSPKAQRLLAQATRDIATAEKLHATKIPKEVAAAERRIAEIGDQVTKTARQIEEVERAGTGAVRAFDRTRRYVAPAFRTDNAWATAVDQMVGETLDNGGATFNPHENRLIRPAGQGGADAGYAVGVLRDSARTVEMTGQAQTDAVAVATALDETARAYQDLLQNPDVVMSTLVDDNNVAHVKLVEIVPSRDEALLKAAARTQENVYDLARSTEDPGAFTMPPGRPDVSAEFLQRHQQRTRYATQLRRSFDTINARRAEKGLRPLVSEADIDAQMAVNDLLAVTMARTQPERFAHPDSVYATMAARQRRRVAGLGDDALFDMALGRRPEPALRKAAHEGATKYPLNLMAKDEIDLADALSERLGKTVRPHDLRSAFWAWALDTGQRAAADAGHADAPVSWQELLDTAATDPDLRQVFGIADEDPAGAMFQRFKDKVLGATVAGDTRNMMWFFDEADPITLAHEHAHALRQILGADVATIERAYKVTDGSWSKTHEERFARDFETYLATGAPPTPGLATHFDRIRSLLSDVWRVLRGRRVHGDVRELFDRLLNPAETTYSLADVLPEMTPMDAVREAMTDGVYSQTGLSPAQRADSTPLLPELRPNDVYRRGIEGGQALAAMDAAQRKAAELGARKARLEKDALKIKQTLLESRLPSQVHAQRLRSRSDRAFARIARDMEDPSIARVPAAWQPLWSSVKSLHRQAETIPALAEALQDLPDTWTAILQTAAASGFDPAHVRSFQPSEVRQLVYENVRLGKRGRDLGQTVEAGTRKGRRVANARTRSLSALAAATIEATHETHTNALADFIEQTYARPIDSGTIPAGWVGWDTERSFLLTGERASDGSVQVEGLGAPTKMIPKEVKSVLDSYQRDYTHPAFQTLRRATDVWRLFVLTLSPRWYVNNFAGNLIMSTKEGVGLRDWQAAWDSYRRGGVAEGGKLRRRFGAGRDSFGDAAGAIEGSVFAEAGQHTLVPYPLGREGLGLAKTVGRGEQLRVAGARLRRANEVVDEMARVAVYHANTRRGMSHAEALQRTYEALVDYNDLTPAERQMVRAVVPFYAWQKGILKLTARFPIDNPQVAGVMLSMDRIQRDLTEDEFGGPLPKAYSSIVKLPGLGNVNLRALNPFQDASALTTPQGIFASMSPFFEIAARNAAGAPEGGFAESYRVDDLGNAVPDTSPGSDLVDVLTGLPQFRLGESLSGQNPSGYPTKAPGQATSQFFGLPRYSDEQVNAIIQRMMKSQQRTRQN